MPGNTATAADVIELYQNIQDLLRRRVLEVVQAVLPILPTRPARTDIESALFRI